MTARAASMACAASAADNFILANCSGVFPMAFATSAAVTPVPSSILLARPPPSCSAFRKLSAPLPPSASFLIREVVASAPPAPMASDAAAARVAASISRPWMPAR